MPWTPEHTREAFRLSEKAWRERKKEEAMFDICKPLPPNKAAIEVADRAWARIDRMRAMLDRCERACAMADNSTAAGEMEDLQRLVAEVLDGPQEARTE